MTTAAINNLWNFLQSLQLSSKNKLWLAERLVEDCNTTKQTEVHAYAKEICNEDEYNMLLQEGFLDNPYKVAEPQTIEEEIAEVERCHRSGYLSAEDTQDFLNKLAK